MKGEIEVAKTVNDQVIFLLGRTPYNMAYSLLKKMSEDTVIGFLAKPGVTGSTTSWLVDVPDKKAYEQSAQTLDELPDDLQEQVSRLIDAKKQQIEADISVNKHHLGRKDQEVLANIQSNLFQTPKGEEDYFVWKNSGELQIVLTQWAMKPAVRKVPLTPIQTPTEPKPDEKIPVTLAFFTQEGDLLRKENFIVEVTKPNAKRTFTNESCSDNKGKRLIGKHLAGTEIKVYKLIEGVVKYEHHFTVNHGNTYNVIFPVFADVEVLVVDQHQTPQPDLPCEVTIQSYIQQKNTDRDGRIKLSNLKVGETLDAKVGGWHPAEGSFQIAKGANRFIIEIYIPPPPSPPSPPVSPPREFSFLINKSDGSPYANADVTVIVNDQEYHLKTDDHGYIVGVNDLGLKTGDKVEVEIRTNKKDRYKRIVLQPGNSK